VVGENEMVLLEVRDQIGWVTLNRPKSLNAMNIPLMEGLRSVLSDVAEDPKVRCVVLRGAGASFSAGGDVKMVNDRHEESEAAAASIGSLMDGQARLMNHHTESITLLREMPKPTVAVVQGHAIGGGLCLALAADIRLMAASGSLRVGFSTMSLSGDFGITFLLSSAVGESRARELMILDPIISAGQAQAWGLVTSVHPDDDLAAAASSTASALADGPTVAFGRMKENFRTAETAGHREVIRVESLNQRISANTADAKEAGAAFAEHRPPHFSGS
jgi:2-(1,2-epoxy-1,2-dihydrophenyl)acetyl-CoA isomerase